jgi:CHASE2 domain-containing sensor protein
VDALPPDLPGDGSIAAPFRGLASFSASDEDAALFFGRDTERDLIVANLLASRLTLLYGQSGVGKSSILCAGAVHQLRLPAPSTIAAPRQLVAYASEWHRDPRATILHSVHEGAQRLSGREWEPPAPGTGLADAFEHWSTRLDAQLLLILDQFEQYFLYHPSAQASPFDEELAAVIAHGDLRLRCLISLREDALVELDRFKDEIPDIFDNRLRLNPLTEPAALEAIRRPVDRCNELRSPAQPRVELERGLAEEVVGQLRDVVPLRRGRGRGALTRPPERLAGEEQAEPEQPMGGGRIEPAHLQLVMQALWAAERAAGSSCLRIDTLAAIGGCAEIVRSYVGGALDGLPPKERAVAARTIRYLVTPSGTKIAHTPTDLSAYVELPRARVAMTLERMSGLRILRPLAPAEDSDEGRYEVFHDLLVEPILDWGASFEAKRLAIRARWLLGWLIAAATAALVTGAYTLNPGSLARLELRTVAARFQIRGPAPDREIVIVELDERSLRALDGGSYPNYALRARDGELIERLLAGDPKAIAYDVEFLSAGQARYDKPLLRAIGRARGRIVLATSIFDQEGDVPLFGLTEAGGANELLQREGARVGYSSFPLEPGTGGVYWRTSYDAGPLQTFAVQAADIAAGHPVPRFSGWALIDYRGSRGSFATVSMIDVLDGRIPPSFFRGKIVVVGVSAPKGEDLHRTPFSSRVLTPGAEVQADAISTVRHGPPIRGVGTGMTLLLILALSFVPLLALPFAWWAAAALLAGAGSAYLLLAQLLFDAGVYLPVVYPLLALALCSCAMIAARGAYAARQERGRRRRRQAGAPASRGASTASAEPAPRTSTPAGAS